MDAARASAPASAAERNVPLFVLLVVVFVGFIIYTAFAFADHGLIGFVEATADNTAVGQVAFDLIIALAIALTLVAGDARRRDLPFAPYLVATVLTGSIGLLAYMLHRTWRGVPARAS